MHLTKLNGKFEEIAVYGWVFLQLENMLSADEHNY